MKNSSIERQNRINWVLKNLTKLSRSRLVEENVRLHKISEKTANNDIYEALRLVREKQSKYITGLQSVLLDRLEMVYEEAYEKGNYKTVLQTLKQISDLFGLNTDKKEIDVKNNDFKIVFK